jgi:hypothetical protein
MRLPITIRGCKRERRANSVCISESLKGCFLASDAIAGEKLDLEALRAAASVGMARTDTEMAS